MIRMERDGDEIVLEAPRVMDGIVKQIPGHRFDSKVRVWRFPLSWATCVVARGVLGTALGIGPKLAEWTELEVRSHIAPAIAARDVEDANLPYPELFPFQRAGVLFLATAGSSLMADQMGLGKTVQTIIALETMDAYPALIVCPNSVKAVWLAEYKRWAPHRRVRAAGSGTAAAVEAANAVAGGSIDVLITNWESLKNLSRLASFGSERLQSCSNCDPASGRRPALCQREPKVLNMIRWSAVVADEAHRAKDPKSAQTRALWALGDRADHRIALTGTPIANDAADLWSVMRFVAPREYPAKWPWVERYALTTPNHFSQGVDIQGLRPDRREEFDRFFLPRFIRRTKADVLPQLPPKVYERRDIVLSGKQRKAYDTLSKQMVAAIDGGTLITDNALTMSLRLRQLASAYGEMIVGSDPNESDYEKSVQLTEPSSKLDEMEQVLDELGERQAVIFAESRQLIELASARLLARGTRHGLITGAIPPDERAASVRDFQAGGLQYLLVTVAAGGEGITLTAADTAIFLQRPWSAVLNAQAEDRLHRVGQEAQSVTYIDIVATDTVEEKVFEALQRKGVALQDVVRDGEQ